MLLDVRPVVDSVDELLAGAERREPFQPDASRSGTQFERVWIDGEPHIVKYLHADDDFMLRSLGDTGSRTLRALEAGLFDAAPAHIDHGVVGAARGVGRNGWGYALLMRDVSADLVSTDDSPFTETEHGTFIDHLAAMCASTWGWRDEIGLAPYGARWAMVSHDALDADRALGWPERVPRIAAEGWERFAERAPAGVASAIDALLHDSHPLADALARTPSCFLHGDWKASNLGIARDGRTVLIDWVYLGAGPACHELGWYVSLNRQKLPHPKEQVIADFRAALERHGIATEPWWDEQLDLCLLGTVVQHGWEKALGDDAELGWWCDRAREGLARL